MYVYEILNSGGIGPVRKPESRPVDKPEVKPQQNTDSLQSGSDKADIGKVSQEDSRSLEGAKLVIETLPEVRTEKVELARQRLAEGYYDKPDVRDAIAGKMLADPEANPIIGEIKDEDAASIRNKIQSGFYDQPDIQDKIAGGMIDDALSDE
ncbi:flagellar biosynthesis anti-sigma factor FlgM [bacterium]|nr:flagellar biosynthesis anti-sigma factor FlgM [bacterium]